MPKGQGAEQECGLALGMVAAEARGSIAARQVAGTLPWLGVTDSAEEQRLQADHAVRLQESANSQLGGPEKLTDARCSKTEAWRTTAKWMTVTSCVTQSWC